MALRRWLRRIERDARASADTYILVDEETGEEFEAPKGAFLRVLCATEEEPDPAIAPLLDRLERLYYLDSGERFWLEDMTHTGKTAANSSSQSLSGGYGW